MYKEKMIMKGAEILAVTPLLPGHKISRETKINIRRCDVKFNWVLYEGENNIPTNVSLGIKEFERRHGEPKYVIIIDRDIIPGRNFLGKLHTTLSRSDDEIAYCYSNFEFQGAINAKFCGIQFNAMNLLNSNYISSNSLIKYEKLKEIGGFVTDDKYRRLLDWALWLKFLSFGYKGVLCESAHFIAISDPESVSAGTREEYLEKYKLVKEDFVEPILEGLVI